MHKIGTGIASFGMSGQVFHGPLLYMDPGFEVISVLERSKMLSASLFPNTRIAREYKELLSNDQIEMIVVNTPDPMHYEMTRKALEAGKHVVVEKPFVQESSQGQELIAMAGAQNLTMSVFHNRRWDGDFLTVQDVLQKGYLGRLVEYEAHVDRFRNVIQEGTWKEDPESGTGTLFNLGSHLIDQALVLFGSPSYINADISIQRTGGKIDDAFTLWLGYDDVRVTLKTGYLIREAGPRYQLHGTHGSYVKYGIDPQEDDLKAGKLPGGDDWGKERASDWGILNAEVEGRHSRNKYETLPGDYRHFYRNVYSAIREAGKLDVTAHQANQVIRVIEAARESSRKGKRVPFTG